MPANQPSLQTVLADPVRFTKYLLQPLNDFLKYPGHDADIEPWQEDWLRMDGHLMGNCTRQGGKSRFTMLKILWKALTIPNSLHLVYASQDQVKEDMLVIHTAIDMIDKNLNIMTNGDWRLSPTSDALTDIELPNKSRILGRAVGAQKGEAVRGKSAPHTIVLDEARQIPDNTFLAIYPMIVANPISQIILISTPGLMQGFFYEEWKHAWDERERIIKNGVASPWAWKSQYYTIFKVPWWQTIHVDKKKIEDARRRFGDAYVKTEFECEFGQGEYGYFPNAEQAVIQSPSIGSLEIPSFNNWQEANK